jgi:hypothetical protein
MGIRRLIAAILIAAILGTGMPAPREAEAVDTAVIVVASVVGWFGLVWAATYFIRNRDSAFGQSSVSPLLEGQEQQYMLRPAEPETVRFGAPCARTAGGPSLVCW